MTRPTIGAARYRWRPAPEPIRRPPGDVVARPRVRSGGSRVHSPSSPSRLAPAAGSLDRRRDGYSSRSQPVFVMWRGVWPPRPRPVKRGRETGPSDARWSHRGYVRSAMTWIGTVGYPAAVPPGNRAQDLDNRRSRRPAAPVDRPSTRVTTHPTRSPDPFGRGSPTSVRRAWSACRPCAIPSLAAPTRAHHGSDAAFRQRGAHCRFSMAFGPSESRPSRASPS
jgi:hypothetical protein